jgi:hypothetical protein
VYVASLAQYELSKTSPSSFSHCVNDVVHIILLKSI